MSLNDKDLKAIKNVVNDSIESNNDKLIDQVKDIVEFSIEKSEQRTDSKFEGINKRFEKLEDELHSFREEMHREISDIASTNREFLAKLDNHETRISKLETKIA